MYHPRYKGSHYDIGLKLGKLLKKQNVDFDEIIRLDGFQKDFGKKSQVVLSNVFPEVCDEIRGMTDGLNYPYEKFASWLLCMGCCYDPNIRYKTAYKALKKNGYINGIEYAENILGGKYGFMCQYDKQLNFDTIWSSVFDISNNKIYRAEGNPSRARFKEDIRSNKF